MPRRHAKLGFTLIELLVVIAIIAILAAILFPVFVSARRASYRSGCLANSKQIGNALLRYIDDNDNRFPPVSYWFRVLLACHNRIPREEMDTKLQGFRFLPDFLAPYIKNGKVWLCPALKPGQRFENNPIGVPTEQKVFDWYTYGDNGGQEPRNRGIGGNWMFNIGYFPGGDGHPPRDISGEKTEIVVQPSKAMVTIEIPYWGTSPHYSDTGRTYGVHALYFDGHTRMRLTNNFNAMYEINWIGYRGAAK